MGNGASDLPLTRRICFAPGDAMDDDTTPMNRASEYRNTADMMRLLAQQMRFRESRDRLLGLADSFDKLADRVEELTLREPMAANVAD
jgi:hypothetical protein